LRAAKTLNLTPDDHAFLTSNAAVRRAKVDFDAFCIPFARPLSRLSHIRRASRASKRSRFGRTQ
jgi:hypothetical protein